MPESDGRDGHILTSSTTTAETTMQEETLANAPELAATMGPPPPPADHVVQARQQRRRQREQHGDGDDDGTASPFKLPAVPAKRSMTRDMNSAGTSTTTLMGPPPAPTVKMRRSDGPRVISDETVQSSQLAIERGRQKIHDLRIRNVVRIRYLEGLLDEYEQRVASLREELETIKNLVNS